MSVATHESLLVRLQDIEDASAWDEFYETYRSFIFNFARQRGCSEAMAQDVLQETLMTFIRIMPRFKYDPGRGRFRAFLLTVVKSRIVDAFRRDQKQRGMPTSEIEVDLSGTIPDEWHENWEREWERQWAQHIMLEALKRVQCKVRPHVYESFRRYVLNQEPATTVASEMGMSEANVYNQRRRVLNILEREIAELRTEWEDR